MPRYATGKTLFNDALRLSIKHLKQKGYIANGNHSVTTSFRTTGFYGSRLTGVIEYFIMFDCAFPHIRFCYEYEGENIEYTVMIGCKLSNLGKGIIYYFICPRTGKKCYTLYGIGGYFLHRSAFNTMYECQTWSKNFRSIEQRYRAYFEWEHAYEKLYEKHRKKTYANKPTKIAARLTKIIDIANSLDPREIEVMMLA